MAAPKLPPPPLTQASDKVLARWCSDLYQQIKAGLMGGTSTSTLLQENIIPSGVIDGVNKTFMLPDSPSPDTSLKVYLDGSRQRLTIDYSVSGNVITYVNPPSAGDNHYVDYRTDLIPGMSFGDGEIPSGSVDGFNTTFTLSDAPSPESSLALYLDGIRQRPTIDYSLAGDVITYVNPPSSGDNHYADYRF